MTDTLTSETVRELRTSALMSQSELAEELGYYSKGKPNRSQIARIESGKQKVTKRLVYAIRYICERRKNGIPLDEPQSQERWQDVLAASSDASDESLTITIGTAVD